MFNLIEPYILAFIPIFVAVDAIGNIPIFASLVEGTTKKQKQKIVTESTATAAIVAFLFMFIGKIVLRTLGISIPDFQIAGGAMLFIIAVRLLLPGAKSGFLGDSANKDVGVFPLGTPLITGPAVLTTTLMMLDSQGIMPTLVSLLLNMLSVWVSLAKSDLIIRFAGINGARAFSKIMYILLAAIGVMMIRKGLNINL